MPEGVQLSAEARQKIEDTVEERARERRRELLEKSQKGRDAKLRFISENSEAVASFEVLFPTPVAFLASYGLGTEQRSRYHQQMESGPAELLNCARGHRAA